MILTKRQPCEPAKEYAFREIYRNIVSFDLPPGAEISVQKISEELKVSRTPVREAFLQLQMERIIEIIPQSGSYIAYVDFDLANSSRFVRLALERAVLEEVCAHANSEDIALLEKSLELQRFYFSKNMINEFLTEDDNFHNLLFLISHHENIRGASNYLAIHFNRVRALWLNTYGTDIPRLVQEHMEIVNAVRSHDLQRARRAIDQHLAGYSQVEQAKIRQRYPEYFHP